MMRYLAIYILLGCLLFWTVLLFDRKRDRIFNCSNGPEFIGSIIAVIFIVITWPISAIRILFVLCTPVRKPRR